MKIRIIDDIPVAHTPAADGAPDLRGSGIIHDMRCDGTLGPPEAALDVLLGAS